MNGPLTWHDQGQMSSDAPSSPYLQWALAPPDHAPYPALDPPGSDMLQARAPWLRRAISKALGDEPRTWQQALRLILPANALPDAVADTPEASHRKISPSAKSNGRVIMALIDDGIAFAHERFRLPDFSTRVDYLWLQGAEHGGANTTVPFGREFTRDQINDLIRSFRRGPKGEDLDEDGLYHKAGALDMSTGAFQSLGRRANHGTAVLDLAAGVSDDSSQRDRMFQSPPERMGMVPQDYDLALVSLPQTVTADTSGTFAEIFIISALVRLLDHIEARCIHEGQDHAVIVNLSLGLSAGPKDGTSFLDRFIDTINEARGPDREPVRIVIPAGNHRLSRSFARTEAPLDETTPPLFWTLPPDDATASFLEIWSELLPRKPKVLPLRFGLVPPDMTEADMLVTPAWDRVHDLRDVLNRFVARAYVQWIAHENGGRFRLTIAVPGTVPKSGETNWIMAGHWRLRIEPHTTHASDGWPLYLMIQRDDMIPGFRSGGRQSRFEDARYSPRHASGFWRGDVVSDTEDSLPYIREAGTLNALATANSAIVVAGCFSDTLKVVHYSAQGAPADGIRDPDIAAPASVNRTRSGLRAAGSRSGSRISVEGTSVAAPTMARELAKATRPVSERALFSGVALLRRSLVGEGVPTVLPYAEDVELYGGNSISDVKSGS